jgi:hypothetical protein
MRVHPLCIWESAMIEDLFFRGGSFLGPTVTALLALPLLLGLAIPYAILHYRDSRGPERDPQLGLKTALYFFFSVSVLVFLLGASIIGVETLNELQLFGPVGGGGGVARARAGFGPAKRLGAALMFAGFTFGLVQFVLIHMATNNRKFPLVRRVFGGWRMVIAGMVMLTSFILLVQLLFQENVQPNAIQDAFAVLCVWTPAWLIDLILLRTRSQQYPVEEEPIPERFGRRIRSEGEGGSHRGET